MKPLVVCIGTCILATLIGRPVFDSAERGASSHELDPPPWIAACIREQTACYVEDDLSFRTEPSDTGVILDWIHRGYIEGSDGCKTGLCTISWTSPASQERRGAGLIILYDLRTGNPIGTPITTNRYPRVIVDGDDNLHLDAFSGLLFAFGSEAEREHSAQVFNYPITTYELAAIRREVRAVCVGKTLADLSERFASGSGVRAPAELADRFERAALSPASTHDVMFMHGETGKHWKEFVVRVSAATESGKTVEMLWRGTLKDGASVEQIQTMAFTLELVTAYER